MYSDQGKSHQNKRKKKNRCGYVKEFLIYLLSKNSFFLQKKACLLNPPKPKQLNSFTLGSPSFPAVKQERKYK